MCGRRCAATLIREADTMLAAKDSEEPTVLARMRATLDGLTRAQIVKMVTESIVPEDVASFAILSEGLSLEALKFLCARTILRKRADETALPSARWDASRR
jgi:hypothetical protein